jgi:hypothetical protein
MHPTSPISTSMERYAIAPLAALCSLIIVFSFWQNQWHQTSGDTVNTKVRFSYTATLGTNHRIYIIGGFEAPSGVNYQSGPVSMMLVRWFDTTSGAWGTDNATVAGSTDAVQPRAYHTTTQSKLVWPFLLLQLFLLTFMSFSSWFYQFRGLRRKYLHWWVT